VRRCELRALDAALYTLQPLRTVTGAAVILAAAAGACAGWMPRSYFWVFGGVLAPYLGYLAHFCFAGVPALGLLLERIPLRHWRYYPHAFLFGLTWIPIAFWGMLTSRPGRRWSHTRHTRSISLAERERLTGGAAARPSPTFVPGPAIARATTEATK
jgi:hypothetical protein